MKQQLCKGSCAGAPAAASATPSGRCTARRPGKPLIFFRPRLFGDLPRSRGESKRYCCSRLSLHTYLVRYLYLDALGYHHSAGDPQGSHSQVTQGSPKQSTSTSPTKVLGRISIGRLTFATSKPVLQHLSGGQGGGGGGGGGNLLLRISIAIIFYAASASLCILAADRKNPRQRQT